MDDCYFDLVGSEMLLREVFVYVGVCRSFCVFVFVFVCMWVCVCSRVWAGVSGVPGVCGCVCVCVCVLCCGGVCVCVLSLVQGCCHVLLFDMFLINI